MVRKNYEFYMHDSFFCCPLLYHHSIDASNSSKYCNEIADYNENLAINIFDFLWDIIIFNLLNIIKRQIKFEGMLKCLKVVSATFLLVSFVTLKESNCDARKKCFLFHLKSSFCSWDKQILTLWSNGLRNVRELNSKK